MFIIEQWLTNFPPACSTLWLLYIEFNHQDDYIFEEYYLEYWVSRWIKEDQNDGFHEDINWVRCCFQMISDVAL